MSVIPAAQLEPCRSARLAAEETQQAEEAARHAATLADLEKVSGGSDGRDSDEGRGSGVSLFI